MDRFLAHIRPPSLFSLSIVRRLSSFKPKSFDIKARIVERKTLRALLDLVDQLDASYLTGKNKLPVPPLVVDTTYLSIKSPDPRFPMPGRIGPDHNQQNKHIPAQSTTKLDPKRYGIDGKLLLDQLLTMTLPVDHQKDSITQLMGTHMVLSSPTNKKEFLSNLINHENLEIRAYDCPSLLRYELHRLFLNYNVLMQPLTAITIILKTNSDMSTWSPKIEEERNELTDQFIKLAHEMCAYLTGKQYWADFIDPSSGRPYYGPHTADTLFETDERYRYFGINIVDLGCCRVVEHLQHGTHIFIGCVFTSALKNDPNVEHLLKEFVNSNKKNKPLEDTTETENDNFMEDLAKALADYHDPRIDLVYKQHLHEQLNRFLIDPNSWQIALATFQQQQHQNVVLSPLLIYFLLQVLEHSIRHRYGDQQQIRQILLWLFLHLFDSIPVFVRSKLCLLIVQIVRCDNQWSLDEYFQTCYHLMETQPFLGLLLLTTTIEELGQLNEDCTIKRCNQLKTILNQHVPHILQIIHVLINKHDYELKDALLIKQQVLRCLDRLINRLSILPLPSQLIDDLFQYASSTWSIDALNCIHELILKQHLPRQYDAILHASLRHVIQLILIVEQNLSATIINKLTEILHSLFNLHLKRCESIESFPMFELLTGFYKFTLQQTTQDGFYACLDIWSIFIEYIKTNDEIRIMNKENSLEKYSQVLSSLSQELIQRIHNGQSIINNLEETTDLNDSETAIDRYIRESVDILSKLADIPILSSNILNLLITLLQPDIEKYKSIQKLIQTSPDSSQQYLLINNESMGVCSQILNSLNYLLYAFSRIANSCLLDNNNQQQSHFQTRLTLVHQFVQLIIYIIHIRFDLIHCSSKQLQNEFINVQTRSFECVNNLSQWLSQMLVLHNSNQDNRRLIQELITHIIDNCAPLIDSNNFDKSIAISVGSILSSLIPLTRQHMTFNEMNSIKHLIHRILSWNVMSNLKTNFPLYKLSIKIVLLLILAEQQSAEHFLGTIFQPLNTILSEPTTFFNQQQEPGSMRRTFLEYTILLTEVIESIRTENNKIRQHLFSSIQHLIINLNRFLSVIINRDTECETVLISLLLICFEILRTQMGKELVNTILQTTFSVFNIENIRNVLREPKPTAHTAVSRFLEFLSVLVNEPGNSKLAQQFLPTIIELCTTALYPAIRENFALDIRENYYKLVHNLLINNWRYFFKGNVLTTLNGDTETTANEHSFIQLMESIAWSFSQSDIEQFRTNLSSCNELQLKCGLYTKSIFHQHMSQALLSLLLTVLLVRSHELCRDDIISTLFYILTNDKTNNFVYFIQNYLEQSNIKLVLNDKYKHALLENYSRNETDLPSFAENLNNFTHDYRHHTTTSSL
ncbi:unnamed protein product [Rotaria magnacalcarata]|uniref:Uncharacterized protein n=1 Tax=Rotaria magnacalcarata TaxID=392030 RepID=A0A816LPQ4_9BILA|nr:unnamed protein product [Rotaria magnacalcarata]